MNTNIETKILTANMGSCQCGDVYTKVVIYHIEKTIVTEPESYKWMSGRLFADNFSVSYAGSFKLPGIDYHHEIRNFTEEESILFNR